MLGALLVTVVMTVTIGLGGVAVAVAARHRAQAGADLAALAAALALPSGVTAACERAAALLHTMGLRLADCVADGLDIVVEVAVPVRTGRWELGTAYAQARAGPA